MGCGVLSHPPSAYGAKRLLRSAKPQMLIDHLANVGIEMGMLDFVARRI